MRTRLTSFAVNVPSAFQRVPDSSYSHTMISTMYFTYHLRPLSGVPFVGRSW